MSNVRLIDRIEEDFRHGGKLGPRSTARVIQLLRQMDDRITDLEKERRHEGPKGLGSR